MDAEKSPDSDSVPVPVKSRFPPPLGSPFKSLTQRKTLDDIEYAPEFHPTSEEFSEGMQKYLARIDHLVGDSAIFKVIPPKDWQPRSTTYREMIDSKCFTVKKPIE